MNLTSPMKPLLRGHLHQAMFFVALGAGIPLLFEGRTLSGTLALLVYVICAATMFGVSAVYHRVNWPPEKRLLWRKLDHCCIYLMIAGTFTPVAHYGLFANDSLRLLVTIWSVTFLGILQSFFFVNLPKLINAVFYLVAGYMVLPYLSELRASLGDRLLSFILLGGVAYSLGALCYAFKRPVLNASVFGYHEVFHLMVNVGAILHFCTVYSLVHR